MKRSRRGNLWVYWTVLAGFGFVVGVLSGRLLFLSLSLLTATAQSARGQGCVCNNVVAVVVVDVVVTQVLMSIEKVEDGLDWQLQREYGSNVIGAEKERES